MKNIKVKNNMKRAIQVFDEWADKGRDEGMERGHASSGARIIEIAQSINSNKRAVSIIDIGCGNGWMLKKATSTLEDSYGVGVDGSSNMVRKAQSKDSLNSYLCEDLNHWVPKNTFDIVISMEVLYYLDSPNDFLKNIYLNGMKNGSIIIIGIDHYLENEQSLSWPQDLSVNMKTLSISEWVDTFDSVGFSSVNYEQHAPKDNWMGTLIVSAKKVF